VILETSYRSLFFKSFFSRKTRVKCSLAREFATLEQLTVYTLATTRKILKPIKQLPKFLSNLYALAGISKKVHTKLFHS
jgi:hypothetical protein